MDTFPSKTSIADTNGGENSIGFTKLGAGTLVLGGASTYTGPTLVEAGTLKVNGSLATSGVLVKSGAVLGGSGTIAGSVIVDSGARISPGNSPGTLTTGSETWTGGGGYVWEINKADGTKGSSPGWDWLNIDGDLTLASTSGDKFTIYVHSLTLGGAAGPATGFVYGQTYTYPIVTASGPIADFSPDLFLIDHSAFSTNLGTLGTFAIEQSLDGTSINLVFTAVPEPRDTAVAVAALLAVVVLLRRRCA